MPVRTRSQTERNFKIWIDEINMCLKNDWATHYLEIGSKYGKPLYSEWELKCMFMKDIGPGKVKQQIKRNNGFIHRARGIKDPLINGV